jgi:hypothetical protein
MLQPAHLFFESRSSIYRQRTTPVSLRLQPLPGSGGQGSGQSKKDDRSALTRKRIILYWSQPHGLKSVEFFFERWMMDREGVALFSKAVAMKNEIIGIVPRVKRIEYY